MDPRLIAAVLEDLAVAMDYWAEEGGKAITQPDIEINWVDDPAVFQRVSSVLRAADPADVTRVLKELMRGLMHSALATFDGASASAEIGRIYLADEFGNVVDDSLHEKFVEHLLETDRLS